MANKKRLVEAGVSTTSSSHILILGHSEETSLTGPARQKRVREVFGLSSEAVEG